MPNQVADATIFEPSINASVSPPAPLAWPAAVVIIGGLSIGLWAAIGKIVAALLL